MSVRLQIIVIIIMIAALVVLTNMVRRKSLEMKYYLPWLLMIVLLVVVTAFPHLLEIISEFLGIESPINMIFFCGFIFSLIIIFSLTIALSRMSNRIRSLAQKLALLEQGIDNGKVAMESNKH